MTSNDVLDLNQVAFYISLLDSDFFTRKSLRTARDIEIPLTNNFENSGILEIIVNYSKKKLGTLKLAIEEILNNSGEHWYSFDLCEQ